MIKWKVRGGGFLEGYIDNDYVSTIYENNYEFQAVIVTSDGYVFLFNQLPDFELTKNVCELALTENKPWEWWLENQEKWWYENVSQV